MMFFAKMVTKVDTITKLHIVSLLTSVWHEQQITPTKKCDEREF